jgi:hypothetical protein
MAIQVFTKVQDPSIDTPAHKANRTLAALVVAGGYAKKLCKPDGVTLKAIHLVTDLAWAGIKQKYRVPAGPKVVKIPQLLPPGRPCSLGLGYPHVDIRGRSRDGSVFGSQQDWAHFPVDAHIEVRV